MKRRISLFLFLAALVASHGICDDRLPSALLLESLGYPRCDWHQAPNCTITDVQVSDQEIFVEFTGRWLPSLAFSDSDKQGFSISRDPTISQDAWTCFAHRFSSRKGEPITITIGAIKGWIVRGGIPLLNFPADSFDLVSLHSATPDHALPLMAVGATAPPSATFSPALQPPDCLRHSISLRTVPPSPIRSR